MTDKPQTKPHMERRGLRGLTIFLISLVLGVLSSPLTSGQDPAATLSVVHIDVGSGVTFDMIRVEPGSFTIGSPNDEPGRRENENSQRISITKAYFLGKYEVTQALWERVMTAEIPASRGKPNESGCYWPLGGSNDSFMCPSEKTGDPNAPVQSVSWKRCKEFIARLNLLVDNGGFRLPTEAEWEYAARAGTISTYFFGNDPAPLNDYAWFRDNSRGVVHPVGKMRPNPWGFHDMYGNVWEYCEDEFVGNYPFREGASQVDYCNRGAEGGNTHQVIRGGSFAFSARLCRSASRSGFDAWQYAKDVGLRLARTAVLTPDP